ncbi:MAG TPA: flagellar hook-basal body complex protein [Pirellulaceae bacterium]|jgi:flagellar hook protein FlgE|nr:flagellar hook-basal body complex protein [Pirellulaceae bacterium]
MGLASALSTSLTGMIAAETTIDVVGNNLANSQTVGFKASEAVFATQFLQTKSLGSQPTATNGGTNPRQVGLGVQVSEIAPDFTQGTIEISSRPSDLAISGDGFFIVQSSSGENLYTRNGLFKLNSQNELVASTGERVLGYGVDDQYQIQRTTLSPVTIPLGGAAVAQPTQNVYLEGTLTPSGPLADTAQVIESAVLGDAATPRPDTSSTDLTVSAVPPVMGVGSAQTEGAGTHPENVTYRYRLAYVDSDGNETLSSDNITVNIPISNGAPDNTVALVNLPSDSNYASINVYRTAANGNDFYLLDNTAMGGTFVDDNSVPLSTTPLDNTSLSGNYTYLVTYYRNGEEETRPSMSIGPVNVVNGRPRLSDLPAPPVPGPGDSFPPYDSVRIYRNLATDSNDFYLVGEVAPGEDFVDSRTDAEISNLTISGNKQIDLDGPKISPNTLLTNVLGRDGLDFEPMFQLGTLSFGARKGDRALSRKEFEITAASTVQDLIDFFEDATGLQDTLDDPSHPLVSSRNGIVGETGTLPPGTSLRNGKIRFTSNVGVDNRIDIGLSAFQLTTATGQLETPNLAFGKIQDAKGQSAVTDFIAYDSLGIPLRVRVTATLESRTGTATTYRWYADSPDNDPTAGSDISVGTGLITFDGEGNFVSTTNDIVTIDRRNVPSASPLEFQLDFSSMTGLAADRPTLSASRQDGSPPGTLTSYIIGEDGVVRGVFSSGVTRDLGQIQLARFANPSGLEQRGQNLYAAGVNSGLPVRGEPGTEGIGKVVAGAVELSNTDVGKNLIDLVLASTQYRGNARVITTAQQLFDELLNLRR